MEKSSSSLSGVAARTVGFCTDGLWGTRRGEGSVFSAGSGFGKCGRCNIGAKYVCKDGPVFRCDEIDELPDEY